MANEKQDAFDKLLVAAHDYQEAYDELPIVLNVELYEYFNGWVVIRDVNVLRSGEVECEVTNRWSDSAIVYSNELTLRPRPRTA